MILYYLIACGFSLVTVLSVWNYVLISRIIFNNNQKHEILFRQLQTQGQSILKLKEDIFIQKDTICILKKNLFQCLQGKHPKPVNIYMNENSKKKPGGHKNNEKVSQG